MPSNNIESKTYEVYPILNDIVSIFPLDNSQIA